GNAAFKAGDFPASIGHYTSAILADPSNPTLYLNRAAAYLKLGKYQDAERDSSSTLKIQKDNVKALFRRGQARMHLENLEGSQNDLRHAIELEPDNPSIREELQRVQKLALEHLKRPKPTRSALPLSKPQTRRVPIEIIDTAPATSVQDDLLTPVSSRPLNRPVAATSLVDAAPISGTQALENKRPEQKPPQNPFHETKQTRNAKYGGGIFRFSGSHTIFRSETSSIPRPKPQAGRLPRPAMNLAAFTRSWNTLTTDKHKWTLLQQIPPVSVSRFFGSSLEADILSSILGVLLTVLSAGKSEQSLVKEYMVYLPQVPRFFLIYTFLRGGDKDRVKEIWASLDGAGVTSDDDKDIKKLWDV
ncbi:hypothetical protein BDM02DRAFT_3090710, partial [Thelephora ganbajun]